MATTALASMPDHSHEGVVNDAHSMTDEQMQEMLVQAADRLRQNASMQIAQKDDRTVYKFPRLDTGDTDRPYTTTSNGVAKLDKSRGVDEKYHKLGGQIRKVEDPVTVRRRDEERKRATAGEQWYNMPRTDLTPELKRDLQLLKMRNVLDPHRHYKKDNGKLKVPTYSQIGTIVEGPTEYFTGRIQNKDRKRTFVEEVLAAEQDTGRFKKKYGDVQDKKTSGKKAHYKALKSKRSASYKKR